MGQRRKTAADLNEAVAIGRRLREAREARGASQSTLGTLVGGRAQQVIDRYESGQSRIPLAVAIRICDKLGLRLEWLAEGSGPMSSSDDEVAAGVFWSSYYASVLRDHLLEELESAANNPSVDPKIKQACLLARSALENVPTDELTVHTFQRLIWEIVRPLNVFLTDRPPDRDPRSLQDEQEPRQKTKTAVGRRIDEELCFRLGEEELPFMSRRYLRIYEGSPAKEAAARHGEVKRARQAFERAWPDLYGKKRKKR